MSELESHIADVLVVVIILVESGEVACHFGKLVLVEEDFILFHFD